MSYEGDKLREFDMPPRKDVERSLLKTLFNNNGVIKEFASRERVVHEIADEFDLNRQQRNAYLETVYKKGNRVKRTNLWHRLLFRAAHKLAGAKLISSPNKTFLLTNKKEWMLTEKGFDHVLKINGIPPEQKADLSVKSFEVEKLAKKLMKKNKPKNYNPIGRATKIKQSKSTLSMRKRGFRQAVVEAYNYKCAVCGLKIYSPNNYQWEVEAAHIVPHGFNGKDDIWNGLSLCRFHHWSFDVGWFSFDEKFRIVVSNQLHQLPEDFGKVWDYGFLRQLSVNKDKVQLPKPKQLRPDLTAIRWHRENILC